jgi:hypothetical protein
VRFLARARAREGGPLGQRFRSGGAGAELSGRQRHDPIETAGRGGAQWSHAYLAHAGGPEARKRIAELKVTTGKITNAIKALARTTEAVSAWILFAGGRTNALMPVAQFNQFEKLEKPIMGARSTEDAARKLWDELSDERDHYLDDVDADLIGHS